MLKVEDEHAADALVLYRTERQVVDEDDRRFAGNDEERVRMTAVKHALAGKKREEPTRGQPAPIRERRRTRTLPGRACTACLLPPSGRVAYLSPG